MSFLMGGGPSSCGMVRKGGGWLKSLFPCINDCDTSYGRKLVRYYYKLHPQPANQVPAKYKVELGTARHRLANRPSLKTTPWQLSCKSLGLAIGSQPSLLSHCFSHCAAEPCLPKQVLGSSERFGSAFAEGCRQKQSARNTCS